MDDLIDDLVRAARRCERAAEQLETDELRAMRERLEAAIEDVGRASSGSWIGYHAFVYLPDFRPPNPGERFDSGSGINNRLSSSEGPWAEHDPGAVVARLNQNAQVSDDHWRRLEAAAADAGNVFEEVFADVLPTLDAILAEQGYEPIRPVRAKIAGMKSHTPWQTIALADAPRAPQSSLFDPRADKAGRKIPPHVEVKARLAEQFSYGKQVAELAKEIHYVTTYLQKRHKMTGKTVARTDGKIFIGHGRSAAWRDLKDFIHDRLHLPWDEFNREPTAGKSTKERLEEMLDGCSFAFLVMTAEDETADGKKQARANVIHEVGLFQGRLGFERAIVLLEEGCEEFSNITGITQIRFPPGKLSAQFEEIRRVLEREKILPV